jgi:hypothetical protein
MSCADRKAAAGGSAIQVTSVCQPSASGGLSALSRMYETLRSVTPARRETG